MHEPYACLSIRIEPRTWPAVARAVHEDGAARVEAAGGRLLGLFTGQIGLGANQGVVITSWSDVASARACADAPVRGLAEVVEASAEILQATVRPREPEVWDAPGVYAHRWFELAEPDWPEFVELSNGAWPSFERTNDCQVLGFWRSLDVEAPDARVLLLTRYASLGVWEQSRGHRPDTKTEPEAWQRFVRRATLTRDTVVCTTQLLHAPR